MEVTLENDVMSPDVMEKGGDQVNDSLAVKDDDAGMNDSTTTQGDLVAHDIVEKLDAYRRNDLVRGMLLLAVAGAICGAVCFVPTYSGWDHLKIPSTFFTVAAFSAAKPIPGEAIFMGVFASFVIVAVFLLVMAELALRDLVDGVTEKNVFSFCMILLSTTVTSVCAPSGMSRIVFFGIPPILFYLDEPSAADFAGYTIVWAIVGVVLAIFLSCLPFVPPPITSNPLEHSASERIRQAALQSSLLLDKACYRLYVSIPLAVLMRDGDKESDGVENGVESKINSSSTEEEHDWAAEQAKVTSDLATVNSLVEASKLYLAELSQGHILYSRLEIWIDPAKAGLAAASAQHLVALCEIVGHSMELLQGPDFQRTMKGIKSKDDYEIFRRCAKNAMRISSLSNKVLRDLVRALDPGVHHEFSWDISELTPVTLKEAQELTLQAREDMQELFKTDIESHKHQFVRRFSSSVLSVSRVASALHKATEKDPARNLWKTFLMVFLKIFKPVRFYKERAGGSLVRELILISRPVLAIGIGSLWPLIPYLSEGGANWAPFEALVKEVPMTVGLIWIDVSYHSFNKCLDRALGTLLGVLLSVIYFLYIPGHPHAAVPFFFFAAPVLACGGFFPKHSYVQIAATAGFCVTFFVSAGAMGGIDSVAGRNMAVQFCVARVLATVIGIAIVMLVITLYFPQKASQSYYMIMAKGLSAFSDLLSREADRTLENGDSVDKEANDTSDLTKLSGTIKTISETGVAATSEYSYAKTQFPGQLAKSADSCLKRLSFDLIDLMQASRIMRKQTPEIANSETLKACRELGNSGVPDVLRVLEAGCNDAAYNTYWGKNRISVDVNAISDAHQRLLRLITLLLVAYDSDVKSDKYNQAARTVLSMTFEAQTGIARATIELTRSLCPFLHLKYTKA